MSWGNGSDYEYERMKRAYKDAMSEREQEAKFDPFDLPWGQFIVFLIIAFIGFAACLAFIGFGGLSVILPAAGVAVFLWIKAADSLDEMR
jgi:hypothetical protein